MITQIDPKPFALDTSFSHLVSPVKSDSVRAYQKYGISRYELINTLTKDRTVNPELHDALEVYHLELTSFKFVQNLAKQGATQIIDEDRYTIIWKTPRGKILKETSGQYFVSYRKAKPEYNLPAYVMIWKKVY